MYGMFWTHDAFSVQIDTMLGFARNRNCVTSTVIRSRTDIDSSNEVS